MKKIVIEYFMWFVLHWKPWFSRGGSLITGSNGGVFGFGHGYGRISSHDSFRVIYYEIINKKNNNHVYYIFFIERFVYPLHPWFRRGGSNDVGIAAGVFCVHTRNGPELNWVSFRVIY